MELNGHYQEDYVTGHWVITYLSILPLWDTKA